MIATIHPCDTGELLIIFHGNDGRQVEVFVELPDTAVSSNPSRDIHVHEHSISSPMDFIRLIKTELKIEHPNNA